MDRRTFFRNCSAASATAWLEELAEAATEPATRGASPIGAPPSPAGTASGTRRAYRRSLLVDARGEPLRASALPPRQNLVFHYPYEGTPAFLIELGRPTARSVPLATERKERYAWDGGVGPRGSIVAFSAICAHQLAYPTREISFIAFHERGSSSGRADVIHCCAEHSEYEVAAGARVVGGPATQPLAAILLEHDAARDALYATGTLGGELFEQFFARYEMRLALEGAHRARTAAGDTCVVQPLERYCRQQVRC